MYVVPGCEATNSYPLILPHGELCEKAFGDRLPITIGTIQSSFDGFWQARCCPKSYE